MKVKDLIKELQKLDPDLYIYGFEENEKSYQVMDITGVDVSKAETYRDKNNKPMLKFDLDKGRMLAFINLTVDF